MAEWFAEWFGDEYLELYPHRDEQEADRLVELLRSVVPWQAGWRTLDVGCGSGRHLAALARHGAAPIGVDLSAVLLRRARSRTGCPLVRADMRRLPVRPGSVDLALNLFTSFGYFSTDEEHDTAMAGMLATVRRGGWFVLDFLDADWVRASLVPRETTRLGGHTAVIERRLSADQRLVAKVIQLEDGRRFEERVRLFSFQELERMIVRHGAAVTSRFGSYDGGPIGAGPRAILIARTG